MDQGYRYAGWFMLDVRLAGSLLLLCASVAVLVVALWFRDRSWHELVTGFVAIFSVSLAATLVLTSLIASFPALTVETFFPIP